MQYMLGKMTGAANARLVRKELLVAPDEGTGRLKVVCLTFKNPEGKESLGVRMDYGDVVKVLIPNYKPKSYSMSAEREGEFDLTVKVYPGGRCSGYLDRIEVGECIRVFRMGSRSRHEGGLVGLLAFGVGITEALPIASAELAKSDTSMVTLLWALRTHDDEFWQDHIDALSAEFGKRFLFVRIFSRDGGYTDDRGPCLQGHVNPQVLTEVFDGTWGTGPSGINSDARVGVRFLTVGTKAMMRAADALLLAIGYPMPQHQLLPF